MLFVSTTMKNTLMKNVMGFFSFKIVWATMSLDTQSLKTQLNIFRTNSINGFVNVT